MIWRRFCILLCLLALSAPVIGTTYAQQGLQVQANDNVRLRTAPSYDAETLEFVTWGTVVTVLAVDPTGDWYQVNHNGVTGWVVAEWFIPVNGNVAPPPQNNNPVPESVSANNAPSAPAASGMTAQCLGNVKLRSEPSTTAIDLGLIPWGAIVTILGTDSSGLWYQLSYNGQVGWAAAEWFTLVNGSVPVVPPSNNTAPGSAAPATAIPNNSTVNNAPASSGTTVRSFGNVNLRTAPSFQAEVLDNVGWGEIVSVLASDASGLWYQVNFNGQIGWVLAEWFVPDSGTVAIPAAATPANSMPNTVPDNNIPAVALPLPIRNFSGVTTRSHEIFSAGQAQGNLPNVFTTVGDSITEVEYFLIEFGRGNYNLQNYGVYQDAINFFNSSPRNPFTTDSQAAKDGWTAFNVLDPASADPLVCRAGETPLVCEYRVTKPSIALIMIGTNDLSAFPITSYESSLREIVDISIQMGVIPVLSTVPPQVDWDANVNAFNQVIANVAQAYNVPLWDYYTPMAQLPMRGLDGMGKHPSFPDAAWTNPAVAFDLSPQNLNYGYPLRNLMALQILDALWRQVIAPRL